MAKFIKTIFDRVNFGLKKGLSGYVSPDRIIDEVHAEQLNVWRKYIDEYSKTQKINMYLKPFEKRETVTDLLGTIEGSKAVLACNYYPLAITTASGLQVQKLTIAEYSKRITHPNLPPVADYPICKFEGNTIYVYPKTDVIVNYIALPTKPVYATTLVGDDYVYDDDNSIDIEFPEPLHDDIMNRVLSNIGINMRDAQLMQFSDQQKASEGR